LNSWIFLLNNISKIFYARFWLHIYILFL
jgi:hypothetical protein